MRENDNTKLNNSDDVCGEKPNAAHGEQAEFCESKAQFDGENEEKSTESGENENKVAEDSADGISMQALPTDSGAGQIDTRALSADNGASEIYTQALQNENDSPKDEPRKRKRFSAWWNKAKQNVCVEGGYVKIKPLLAWVLIAVLVVSVCIGGVSLGLLLTSDAQAENIYENFADCTVDVLCYNAKDVQKSRGSGFFISRDGTIATCYHVISNSATIKISTLSGEVYTVEKVLFVDKLNDVALIKINKTDCRALTLSKSLPKTGEKVFALGLYQNGAPSVVAGNISRIKMLDGDETLTHTAPITYGFSGAPLLNGNGQVVGIIKNMDTATFYSSDATSARKLLNITENPQTMYEFLSGDCYDIGHLLEYVIDAKTNTATVVGVKAITSQKYVSIPSTLDGAAVTKIKIDAASSERLSEVEHITISEGITAIYDNSFVGAKKLLSILVPSSLSYVENSAFACPNLAKVMLGDNTMFLYENSVLYNANKTVLYLYGKDKIQETFDVPDTVKYVAQGAFANNNYLKTVNFGGSLDALGTKVDGAYTASIGAFENCISLFNVNFNNARLTLIGRDTFRGCISISKITMPRLLEYVGDYAFADCPNLISVVFTGSVVPKLGTSVNANSPLFLYANAAAVNAARGRADIEEYQTILKYVDFLSE